MAFKGMLHCTRTKCLNDNAIADELPNSVQLDYCTECLATRYSDLFYLYVTGYGNVRILKQI